MGCYPRPAGRGGAGALVLRRARAPAVDAGGALEYCCFVCTYHMGAPLPQSCRICRDTRVFSSQAFERRGFVPIVMLLRPCMAW